MSAILPFPLANGGAATGHSTSILADLLANPVRFGPPTERSAYVKQTGVREVMMGPRSPRRGSGSLNGHAEATNGTTNGHLPEKKGKASSAEDDDGRTGRDFVESDARTTDGVRTVGGDAPNGSVASSSTLAGPSTPSKRPASPLASPKRKTKPLANGSRGDLVDLAWPVEVASKGKGAGLFNPSMACYANATLQILLHTPPVLAHALAHEGSTCGQQKKGFCMLCALRILAGVHYTKERYAPSPVHKNLGSIRKGFKTSRQEDTHEFFRFVTDALQAQAQTALGITKDAPEKLKQTTWIYDTWGGKIRSRVVCSRCEKPSDTFDTFLDLSLDVTKGSSPTLRKMLSGFIREDKLEGDNKYHCDNCKAKANATKSFRIARAPPILTFTLKRFRINYNSYSGRPSANKFNGMIDYPERLDIAPFMVDPENPHAKYRLFGVTCHRGSELRFGHYTSFVKAPNGTWYNADDEDMEKVTLKAALGTHTAYLLSYIRVSDEEYATGAPTPAGSSAPSRASTPNGVSTPQKASQLGETARTAQAGPSSNKRKFEGSNGESSRAQGTNTPRPGWSNNRNTPESDAEEGEIDTPPSSSGHRFAPTGAPVQARQFGAGMSRSERDPDEMYAGTKDHKPRWASAGERDRGELTKKQRKKKEREERRLKKRSGAPQPYKFGSGGSGAEGPKAARRRMLNGNMQPRKHHKGI